MSFFQKPLDNFLWNFGISILMPVTLCTQKEFVIESKLNGFFGVLLLQKLLDDYMENFEMELIIFSSSMNNQNFSA